MLRSYGLSFTASSSLFLQRSSASRFGSGIGIQDGEKRAVPAEAGHDGCGQVPRSEQLQTDGSGRDGSGSVCGWLRMEGLGSPRVE